MKKEELLDLVTMTEAARIRQVSHQAILDLIKRERLSVVEVGGRKFLSRSEVMKFTPSKGGRPKKQPTKKGVKK